MDKVVVFNIGDGNFEQGFPVTLLINEEGKSSYRQERGRFSPAPDIPKLFIFPRRSVLSGSATSTREVRVS